MLSGDNGVLKQAGNAKNLTNQAQLEEEVDIAYATYAEQIREINDLEYYLKKIDNVNVEKLALDTWCVTRGNSSVTVSDDGEKMAGKTVIWDGTSVESPKFKDFNWYIETPAQLKFLADFVNNGNTLTSEQETLITKKGYRTSDVKMESTTMVYLMNNLDLGARPGSGSTEEQKWETESNESRKWTPIGTSNALKLLGTFEGNNNTIKGIYVNQTANYAGLFGNSNTIQNLTIADSYIKGGSATGGIVGALRGTGKIENCHNKNTTVILREGNYYIAGGIVGQISSGTSGINNCSNTGKIIGYGIYSYSGTYYQNVGGVVGTGGNSSTIDRCSNSGIITSNSYNCGGIVGAANKQSKISNCYNNGIINGNVNVGGIEGATGEAVEIINCYSKGKVSGTNFGFLVASYPSSGTYSNLYYLSSLEANSSGRLNGESTITQAIDDDLKSLNEFLIWLENQ